MPHVPVKTTLPLVVALSIGTMFSCPVRAMAQVSDPNASNGIDLLSGFLRYWTPGPAWNNGAPTALGKTLLPINLGEVAAVALLRNHNAEIAAYYDDRRNQSYSVIDGLGPLTARYLLESGATTTIPIFDASTRTIAYSDAGTGPGSTASMLGSVVKLVSTLRGSTSSTTPTKNYFLYPRPWRQNLYGYSLAFVVPASLVPAESQTPATDSGFPSGHTNAAFLTAYAMAYAVPERFQEMLTRASELGLHRIVAGMHSPLDVIGGRDFATFTAINTLGDPANASLKAAARADVVAALAKSCPTEAATCAHPTADAYTPNRRPDASQIKAVVDQAMLAPPVACANTLGVCSDNGFIASADRFADRTVNEINWNWRLTYGFPAVEDETLPAIVPANAEVLLETRQPYLGADQRREVLRTTEIASGSALLDDPAGYGRMDLFRAADGYGRFDTTVTVTMDASRGSFGALDAWRNDIGGGGGLVKNGTGTLVLAGQNSFTGGIDVKGGTLAATDPAALGRGDVLVESGTLHVASRSAARIEGGLVLKDTATLAIGGGHANGLSTLIVRGAARLGGTLSVMLPAGQPCGTLLLLQTGSRTGRFGTVQVSGLTEGRQARLVYFGNAALLVVAALSR
ncbi:MAG: phosphatase PAP2 family protein [Janthinobacterium lividum]